MDGCGHVRLFISKLILRGMAVIAVARSIDFKNLQKTHKAFKVVRILEADHFLDAKTAGTQVADADHNLVEQHEKTGESFVFLLDLFSKNN
jgi:hypothetical protein